MPPKQRKITEVLMECPECPWIGQVIDCDCDADYRGIEDEGRLRGPKCSSVVNQIGDKEGKELVS